MQLIKSKSIFYIKRTTGLYSPDRNLIMRNKFQAWQAIENGIALRKISQTTHPIRVPVNLFGFSK